MDALKTVRVRLENGQTREYKKVGIDTSVDKLMAIVGDAAWQWILDSHSQGEELRAVLFKLWSLIDTLPQNTSGCRLWKNDIKTHRFIRPVCQTNKSKTCSLENTPNKVSRLEFMQGMQEILGIMMSWCHIDTLMRHFNKYAAKELSRNCICKSAFVTALWPYVSKKAFEYMLSGNTGCTAKITGIVLQGFLVADPRKDHHYESKCDSVSNQYSIIDENDL